MAKGKKIMKTGLSLAALAAIGTYFLYGERGAKNRERVKGWALKMKGEVLEKVERVKDINEDTYYKVVDAVALRYKRLKRTSAAEVNRLSKELKRAWTHVKKQVK